MGDEGHSGGLSNDAVIRMVKQCFLDHAAKSAAVECALASALV